MKKINLLLIILFVLFLFFVVPHMKIGTYYYNASRYIENNGQENFVDMYNPKSYFDENEKKVKLTQMNIIEIVYHGDPKKVYFINFEDIDHGIDLSITVNKNLDELDEYVTEEGVSQVFDDYHLYVRKNGEAFVVGYNEKYMISLDFYKLNMSEEEIQKCIMIGEKMIKDTFELNS